MEDVPDSILKELDVAMQLCKPPPASASDYDNGFVPLALQTVSQVGATLWYQH